MDRDGQDKRRPARREQRPGVYRDKTRALEAERFRALVSNYPDKPVLKAL
jgi:hypothetical protein